MQKKFDVFISYNWKDEKFVNILIESLKANGVKFFLDKTHLKLYDKLTSTLKNNIAESRYLISVVSSNYLSSYWCLFEAIEAISVENIEAKFLPVILKYNIDDEGFDEDFVFKSIDNLILQIEKLENQIIKHKAYDLSPKLDKLNFIKNNLPKIYARIQENIYPEFSFFNTEKFKENLKNLVLHIRPDIVFTSKRIIFEQGPFGPISINISNAQFATELAQFYSDIADKIDAFIDINLDSLRRNGIFYAFNRYEMQLTNYSEKFVELSNSMLFNGNEACFTQLSDAIDSIKQVLTNVRSANEVVNIIDPILKLAENILKADIKGVATSISDVMNAMQAKQHGI